MSNSTKIPPNIAALTENVASEILMVLPGRLGIRMIGAKNFVGGPDSLKFTHMAGKDGIAATKVTLNALDLYNVEYYSTGFKKKIDDDDNVYAEDLRRIWQARTGLYLTL